MTQCNLQKHWENVLIYGECQGSCGLTKSYIDAEKKLDKIRKENNKCSHICSGNCRREGCNCNCGEWHKDKEEDEKHEIERRNQ